MLADFQNSVSYILPEICNRVHANISYHTLNVLLHYLVNFKLK